MLKITIDNEEVVSNKDFTIEEEMLNTSSVILNNVYPKTWENDKDYTSNFYHPNDYSKCLITDETDYPAEAGDQVNGTSFSINVDTSKQYDFTEYDGQTSQASTPTPTSPVPVITATGRQDVVVCGKNLLPYSETFNETKNGSIITGNKGIYTLENTPSANFTSTKTNLISTYTVKSGDYLHLMNDNYAPNVAFNLYFTDNTSTNPTLNATNRIFSLANYVGKTINAMNIYAQTAYSGTKITLTPMIINSSTATTYEAYKGNTYEINLGKNLLDMTTNVLNNCFIQTSNMNLTSISGATCYWFKADPNTTYTMSRDKGDRLIIGGYNTTPQINTTGTLIYDGGTSTALTYTFSNTNYNYIVLYLSRNTSTTPTQVQVEKGSVATSYAPYKTPIELCKIGDYKDYIFKNIPNTPLYNNTLADNKWYLYKAIGKQVLNGGFISAGVSNVFYSTAITDYATSNNIPYSNQYTGVSNVTGGSNMGSQANNTVAFINQSGLTTPRFYIKDTRYSNQNDLNTWLSTHSLDAYYILTTPTTTEITDTELISQLEGITLINGLNNINIDTPNLPLIMYLHYNYVNAYTDIDLLFCGVVKNSGYISLNPRDPHYQTLQVLDFKTFLSEGETLDFVIADKTIEEAIDQVISTIAPYGFIKGNIQIIGADTTIGAYSTKDKTAYDVFNYLADITQSRWTTRLIDENTVAIDFYDPTLLPQGQAIDYTPTYFENNLIDDMSYSYGSNDYRNKQVMTSSQVVGSLEQTQLLYANGYQTQFLTEMPIANLTSITVDGSTKTFATNDEKELGVEADFYYTIGSNIVESETTYSTGDEVEIGYLPIVEGRQIITNNDEIQRVSTSTGRKGVVARYETRNDATTSMELQLIGQSYIKYKGTPEIKLTIQTRSNLWNVGDRVQFNAPITELNTDYMVKSKKTNYITTIDTLFYTFELTSSFNMEQDINYFDNQRAKAKGNIGEGDYISRNVDLENTANVIFYDSVVAEATVVGDNKLSAVLNAPLNN